MVVGRAEQDAGDAALCHARKRPGGQFGLGLHRLEIFGEVAREKVLADFLLGVRGDAALLAHPKDGLLVLQRTDAHEARGEVFEEQARHVAQGVCEMGVLDFAHDRAERFRIGQEADFHGQGLERGVRGLLLDVFTARLAGRADDRPRVLVFFARRADDGPRVLALLAGGPDDRARVLAWLARRTDDGARILARRAGFAEVALEGFARRAGIVPGVAAEIPARRVARIVAAVVAARGVGIIVAAGTPFFLPFIAAAVVAHHPLVVGVRRLPRPVGRELKVEETVVVWVAHEVPHKVAAKDTIFAAPRPAFFYGDCFLIFFAFCVFIQYNKPPC